MAVIEQHVPLLEQALRIPGVLGSPLLLFGRQEIGIGRDRVLSGRVPRDYDAPDLSVVLRRRGVAHIDVLDWFDEAASIRHDMNAPLPPALRGRYRALIDIGSLEHVFDTRQCLENCARALAPGGFYLLHSCVKGYFRHGLHTFHPDILQQALKLNGFSILWSKYSSWDGIECFDLAHTEDVLLWLVARKDQEREAFAAPQQAAWRTVYDSQSRSARPLASLRRVLFPWIPPIAMALYRRLRGRRVRSLVAQGLGDGD